MLEEQDLKLIKKVIQEVVEEEVTPHFIAAAQQFESIDRRFEQIDQRFKGIDQRFEGMDQRFDRVESRLINIETTMVTKDDLEDRLGDFKATLKKTGGQALRQIKRMATELHRNGGLTTDQIVHITTAA